MMTTTDDGEPRAADPRTHTRTHARTLACTHAHTHARSHARTNERTHAGMPARTHARTHARRHARTHARTNARTHAPGAHAERSARRVRQRENIVATDHVLRCARDARREKRPSARCHHNVRGRYSLLRCRCAAPSEEDPRRADYLPWCSAAAAAPATAAAATASAANAVCWLGNPRVRVHERDAGFGERRTVRKVQGADLAARPIHQGFPVDGRVRVGGGSSAGRGVFRRIQPPHTPRVPLARKLQCGGVEELLGHAAHVDARSPDVPLRALRRRLHVVEKHRSEAQAGRLEAGSHASGPAAHHSHVVVLVAATAAAVPPHGCPIIAIVVIAKQGREAAEVPMLLWGAPLLQLQRPPGCICAPHRDRLAHSNECRWRDGSLFFFRRKQLQQLQRANAITS